MYVGRKIFYKMAKGQRKPSNWRSYYGSCKPLKEDIALLGKDKFKREVLSLCKDDRDMAYDEERELFRRDVLKAVNADGQRAYYNGTIGGRYFYQPNFGRGVPKTPEAIAKTAAALTGRKLSAEHCAKISQYMKDREVKPEWCEAISRGRLGMKFTEEHVENMRKSREGRDLSHSEDTKRRISETLKRRFEEERKANGAVKRKPASAEHKANIAASLKRAWEPGGVRRKPKDDA